MTASFLSQKLSYLALLSSFFFLKHSSKTPAANSRGWLSIQRFFALPASRDRCQMSLVHWLRRVVLTDLTTFSRFVKSQKMTKIWKEMQSLPFPSRPFYDRINIFFMTKLKLSYLRLYAVYQSQIKTRR